MSGTETARHRVVQRWIGGIESAAPKRRRRNGPPPKNTGRVAMLTDIFDQIYKYIWNTYETWWINLKWVGENTILLDASFCIAHFDRTIFYPKSEIFVKKFQNTFPTLSSAPHTWFCDACGIKFISHLYSYFWSSEYFFFLRYVGKFSRRGVATYPQF